MLQRDRQGRHRFDEVGPTGRCERCHPCEVGTEKRTQEGPRIVDPVGSMEIGKAAESKMVPWLLQMALQMLGNNWVRAVG